MVDKIASLLLACWSLFFVACAVPREHSKFEIAGESPYEPFSSSEELRTTGLVTEAMSLAKMGRAADAANRLRQALFLDSDNVRLRLNLALVLLQTGEYQEAEELFQGLYQDAPSHPSVLAGYGNALVAQRKVDEGKRYLKEGFKLYVQANNLPQAARMARSISNVAFGSGDEEEALCYSYEAWSLSPTSDQLAAHATLLVGLNAYGLAQRTVTETIKGDKSLGRSPRVLHARAMALYGLGEFSRVVDAEESAARYLVKEPALSSEVATVRWLAIAKLDRSKDSEIEKLRYEQEREVVIDFASRAGYETIFWPQELKKALKAEAESTREGEQGPR